MDYWETVVKPAFVKESGGKVTDANFVHQELVVIEDSDIVSVLNMHLKLMECYPNPQRTAKFRGQIISPNVTFGMLVEDMRMRELRKMPVRADVFPGRALIRLRRDGRALGRIQAQMALPVSQCAGRLSAMSHLRSRA